MIRLIIFSIVTVLSLTGGVWWFNQAPSALPVDTIRVERGVVAVDLSLDGELVNDRQVVINSLLDGEITTIAAREGDTVSKAQTLAEQDPIAAKALRDKARAELALAKAESADAKFNLERAENLSNGGDLAAQTLDDARLVVARAKASVVVAKTSVTIADHNRRDATIRAPFEGVVIEQSTETGQWVEAGTALFTLVARAGQVIEAYVDATDIASVAIGQRATLVSDAWPDESWQSQVDWVAPVVATSERSTTGDVPPNAIAIRLPLGEQAPPVRLGQQVDVLLATDRRDDVLRLPLTALREPSSGELEVMLVRNGKVAVQKVKTGLVTIDMAEITAGLKAGDEIIDGDVSQLQAGSQVDVR